MNRTGSQVAAFSFRFGSAVQFAGAFGSRRAQRPRTQVVEQQLLLSAEEAELEPAEDVVHDRLGKADISIARPPTGLEPSMSKLLTEKFERHAMLQRDRDRQRKTVHQPRDSRTFLSHLDKNFPRLPIRIEPDDDVSLVPS